MANTEQVKDFDGNPLSIGDRVAYSVINHKRAQFRVGIVTQVGSPDGYDQLVYVTPRERGQRSVWKHPSHLVKTEVQD